MNLLVKNLHNLENIETLKLHTHTHTHPINFTFLQQAPTYICSYNIAAVDVHSYHV
jgi:hypothetical protein